MDIDKHIIAYQDPLRKALEKLNQLGEDLTLFVLDDNEKLVGVVTDGDIRRCLLEGADTNFPIEKCMNRNFKYLQLNNYSIKDINAYKNASVKIVPVVDENFKIIRIINFLKTKSLLPFNAVIMAGGRGERLRPLTDSVPKPLLKVGDKAIIEHNIDRLRDYGVNRFFITVKYLGEKIKEHFGDGTSKNVNINYVDETIPLGTIGSVSLINGFDTDCVLVMNSDLLTNIDFEDFYSHFENEGADMSVASISYKVDVPYAVLETNNNQIKSFKEKPSYTYYSNGGVYLIKRSLLDLIPVETHFNATDFITALLERGHKVTHYPILGYWLDIGKHADYEKAQEDIKHIKL